MAIALLSRAPGPLNANIAAMSVTPFTTVAIALLAAFSIVAPSASFPIKLEPRLRQYNVEQPIEFLIPAPVSIHIAQDGKISIGNGFDRQAIPVGWRSLGREVLARVVGYQERAVSLTADPGVRYRDVMRARAVLEEVGVDRVYFVSMDICGSGEGEVAC